MTSIFRSLRVLLVALALSAAPGCMSGPSTELSPIEVPAHQPVESRVTLEEASVIAETALEGLDEGDYEMFAAAWSDELRAAISPEAFERTREGILAQAGRFESILEARTAPGSSEAYVRFYFLCRFEAADLVYVIALPVDGDEVVGVSVGTVAE